MFRIGDFARLAQVSTRTLRLYDRLGLLKPAVVDRFTDYRFYTLDQLPRLNRILALKELGFSLEQIRRMLNEELTAEQLRGMLRMKHAEAEQQACEAQERLARLETRLKQIELEEVMPNYEIVLKKIQPLAEDPNCHACQDQKMMAELKAKADASGQPLEDVFREMAGSEKDGQKTFLRRIEAPDSPPPDLTTAPRLFLRSFGQPPLDPNALPPGPTDDMIVMPFVDAHACSVWRPPLP